MSMRPDSKLGSDPGGAAERLIQAIEKRKSDLIKWIAVMMVIQGACIVALIKFLPGAHS